MKRQHSLAFALATGLVAATLGGPATGADEHPFTGTWTRLLTETVEGELTIHRVNAEGQVHGWYCIATPESLLIYEFAPGAVEAIATERIIWAKIGRFDVKFLMRRGSRNVDGIGPNGKSKVELRPSLHGSCIARIVPLPVTAIEREPARAGTIVKWIAASDDPHPLVGSWTGTRDDGLTIELNVAQVGDEGIVKGLYCNLWSTKWQIFDIGAERTGSLKGFIEGRTLKFEIRQRRFAFTVDADRGTVEYVQTSPSRQKTLTLEPAPDPACASRVLVPLAPG